MTQASTNPEHEGIAAMGSEEALAAELEAKLARELMVARLRLLWDQRRFLFRAAGAGLVFATLIAFLIPKRYESTARLMPPDSKAGSGMALLAALSARTGTGLGTFAGGLPGLQTTGALFVGILGSQTVETRLVDRFDLRRVYGVRLLENARKRLAENTSISEDRRNGIITMTVTDRNPQRAATMANAYIDELNRLVVQLTTSSAHRERVFLEDRLKTARQELEAAEKDFSQFASRNTAINIPEQGKAMVEAAASLQGQLIAAQSELEGLRQIYTDNNVRVRAVRARIAELRHQLEMLGGKGEGTSSGSSTGNESLYPSIRQLPLLGVPYADLYRRMKIQEAVFETLTQEYELAKVEEVKEIPSVKVLDPPEVPERKSFPPRLWIIFLGTFLSLAGGAVWVLGNVRWSEIDSQDPRKQFAQEIFTTMKGHLPWASENGGHLRAIKAKVWSRLSKKEDLAAENK